MILPFFSLGIFFCIVALRVASACFQASHIACK
jgi:hypothetical protein